MSKVLMKGNEAFGEAAIRAGCKCYFGYPITPQNEVPEYMSHELPKAGGAFVQAESELAAVNMAYGAAAAGGRVFISTSSPGLALMQEGLGFICSTEVPIVALNVSRGGPGVGGIQPGQADYFQATRGGYNGDAKIPVFAPSGIQECVDMIYESFDIAEKYRNPVLILADGMIGQMMEPVTFDFAVKQPPEKPWAVTGTQMKREHNIVNSLYLKPEELEQINFERFDKYKVVEENETVAVENFDNEWQTISTVSDEMPEIIDDNYDKIKAKGTISQNDEQYCYLLKMCLLFIYMKIN